MSEDRENPGCQVFLFAALTILVVAMVAGAVFIYPRVQRARAAGRAAQKKAIAAPATPPAVPAIPISK